MPSLLCTLPHPILYRRRASTTMTTHTMSTNTTNTINTSNISDFTAKSSPHVHFALDLLGIGTHIHRPRFTRSDYLEVELGHDGKKLTKAATACGTGEANKNGKD
jgi:hypothetical protein